jgi:hypothetical protein
MVNKALYRKLMIEQHEPEKNGRKYKQFLLHKWHPSCYCYAKRT